MTQRLYYEDSYITSFRSQIGVALDGGRKLVLNETAFYPTSGGQPFDLGTLNGTPVVEVVEEDGDIVHILSSPIDSSDVDGQIDWPRRFDHMQQHTGQHLLSATLAERFGIPTLSFHLGAASSTIDVDARDVDARALEEHTNLAIAANRRVSVSFEESSTASDLRKPSGREGTLRIVSIEGLDRSACGGTHVRSTGEIGVILLRKMEKVRGNLRIEFLCGMRAVRQARSDFDALSRIAKTFSSTIDQTVALVEAQHTALVQADKTRKKLALEVAAFRGRSAYDSAVPDSDGVRRLEQLRTLDDETRAEAQSFTSNEKSIFIAYSKDPPAILFATSKDSGVNAGELLKSALRDLGGRGGGTAQLAQGSLPSEEALTALLTAVRNKSTG